MSPTDYPSRLPGWKDKALFTPGPLTTSATVKQAMLRDLGSRDAEFISIVQDVRRKLVRLGGNPDQYTSVLMQGSGTYGVEATLSSMIPSDGKLLVQVNGAYGQRMCRIAEVHHIPLVKLTYAEDQQPDPKELEQALREDVTVSHVAVVHSETTTGIINPVEAYGEIVRERGRTFIVDAMSSFGAYPIELDSSGIDFLVSSSNKCIEGVPGFSFVLARESVLRAAHGRARTLSLDLFAQWEGLEGDGQFRFTPPTHSILAFQQALRELEEEGGISARATRYRRNHEATLEGMQRMGFKPYLSPEVQGYIISSFYYPQHPRFRFHEFYERLSAKGHVIYPGKLSHADCFRIGHIGRLDLTDVQSMLTAIETTLDEMGVDLKAGVVR